jgi:hypothetical protein
LDFFSFNLKNLKTVFYTVLSINTTLTLATYVAGANVFSIVLLHEGSLKQTPDLLLLLVLVAAVFQTIYQKKMLKKLDGLTDFEEKVAHYLNIYKLRLYWKCSSCLASCFIHILTGRNIFLYFAVFDVLSTWTYFPNKALIRKELKTEDVMFVEE